MIKNPVLKGFHPDPAICRVGDDYYIATSTFQWFPGVEIHHSKDLANWNFLTRPLDEVRLLDLTGIPDSGGVWAPCLTYSEGKFYLVYSIVRTYRNYFKDVDNFLTVSDSIEGPWSDPIYLNSSGFDASLFHDSDGKKYVLNQLWNHRDKEDAFNGIVLQELDMEKKCLTGQIVNIFAGSELGVTEGPHIYKINGMYYLMCAEGGTFYEHAVTLARSQHLLGPYEISPVHPLLSSWKHPELELQKCGHGSLVETTQGEWYLAHLCARPNGNHGKCMLGRETALQKLKLRQDGWFELDNESGLPEVEVAEPAGVTGKAEKKLEKMDFSNGLPKSFQMLRKPLEKAWMDFNENNHSLLLYGKESMESLHTQSLVGIRREDFNCLAETKISFHPQNYQQMAGMALYYDTTNYYYLYISQDETLGRVLILTSCIHGKMNRETELLELPEDMQWIYMRMLVQNDKVQFYYSLDGRYYQKVGEVLDATNLSDDSYDEKIHGLRFTGTFITLSCQDVSGQRIPAEFAYLIYKPILEGCENI